MSLDKRITSSDIAFFSEKGQREKNEDSHYPNDGTSIKVNGLFMVCDGVGGFSKGGFASSILCSSTSDYISKRVDIGKTIDESSIRKSVACAQEIFNTQSKEDPSFVDMATTLTLVYLRENDVLLAHCGDSRIYHFRNKRKLFQTEDHSLVNWLVQRGDIQKEEAISHDKKNVILKSISSKTKPDDVEIQTLTHVKTGDFIFLCSDGVIEAWDKEPDLSNLFEEGRNPKEIIQELKGKCSLESNDNYTCICLVLDVPPNSTKSSLFCKIISKIKNIIKPA